jgi:serine/threonine-protein kinase
MVLIFIPDGEFTMGTQISGTPEESFDEFAHQVYLHSFYIDQTEVTNAMFTLFVEATGYQTTAEREGKSWVRKRNWVFYQQVEGADWRHPFGPETNLVGLDLHPVVHMSWDDAQAYCEWAGRRLPTEAEWEKAARGEQSFIYPWGNQDPAAHLANLSDRGSAIVSYSVDYDDGYALTAPVGSFPAGASPYGALDMAGNALEWVVDNYGSEFYQESPFENPLYTGFSLTKVQRGGSWDSGIDGARSAYRRSSMVSGSSNENGFRCAR